MRVQQEQQYLQRQVLDERVSRTSGRMGTIDPMGGRNPQSMMGTMDPMGGRNPQSMTERAKGSQNTLNNRFGSV